MRTQVIVLKGNFLMEKHKKNHCFQFRPPPPPHSLNYTQTNTERLVVLFSFSELKTGLSACSVTDVNLIFLLTCAKLKLPGLLFEVGETQKKNQREMREC